MTVEYKGQFLRDIKKIKVKLLNEKVMEMILSIKNAASLIEVSNIKKIEGSTKDYRIRIGNYRMGFTLEKDTVVFKRFLHRKDIYKYFP